MISDDERQATADALIRASATATPIPPPTESHGRFDVGDAYAVQERIVERRLASGARAVGWKVGLTSAAMQRQLGVDQPDYGPLLDEMAVTDGGTVDIAALIAPRIEGELAFRLRSDLRGPGVTVADALAAVSAVMPALEVIDSRIVDWRIALADTIADHASCARFVIGAGSCPVDAIDLKAVRMELLVDGEVADRGDGAAVLGDPLRAVAWLANAIADHGQSLHAGDVVLAGALHASVPVHAGMVVEARFSESSLGSVSVGFDASQDGGERA